MKKLLAVLVLSLSTCNVFAEEDCSQGLVEKTPEQVKQCLDVSEKVLIENYEGVIVAFKKLDNGSDKLLEEAQQSWTKMRDANCRVVNLNVPTSEVYGTNAARAKLICEIIMNTQRTDFLSVFQPES